jgi:CHRD domain
MTLTRRLTTVLATAAVSATALIGLSAPAQADHPDRRHLRANLSGAKEVPPGDPDGRGVASVTLRPNMARVCFDISVHNVSRVVGAHIHRGARGTNGPIVVDFNTADNGLDGCVNAPAWLLRAIRDAPYRYYVNVHTTQYPDGAVRGQLFRI